MTEDEYDKLAKVLLGIAVIGEISRQIADAFYDYKYNKEDIGLIRFIPTREDMFTYIHAIVRAAYRRGVLYTTSKYREGYLMLSEEGAGGVIETCMRKEKRKFLRIEMLVVRKEFQGQGYMRRMMDFAFFCPEVGKDRNLLKPDSQL